MTMSPEMQEIVELKRRLWEAEKKISNFYSMLHEVSMTRIDDTENALCEISENVM